MKFTVYLAAMTAACALLATTAGAYVDVELNNNHHVFAESYRVEGTKLIVYRPSGALEIDRATIRSIQERSGEMPSDAPRSSTADQPAPAGAAPSTALQAPPVDPRARDNELSRRLIFIHADRLAATNRGDKEAVEKLEKEAKPIERERTALRKILSPQKDASGD